MKTRFLRLSLTVLATTTLMVGCSQDDVLNTLPEQSDQVLSITASSTGFEAVDAQTRVSENGATTIFEKGDQMGLYVVENYSDADNAKTILRNIPLTYREGQWSADRNIYYYKNADYIAYFPYKADLSADIKPAETEKGIKTAFDTNLESIKADQSKKEDYRKADLMTAKIDATTLAGQSEDTKRLNFTLKHQYSMIEVAIPTHKYFYKAGDANVNYDVPMTAFVLKVASTTGEIAAPAETITPCHLGEGVYRCLVAPGTISVEGSFTDPSDKRPVEFSNEAATTKSLESGKYVRYNVSFNDAPAAERIERSIIGDYFCQDGTIFPSNFQDFPTNIIGIIYAKVGADDFTGEHAEKYSHYVLSIKERGTMGFKVAGGQTQLDEHKVNIDGIPNFDSSSEDNFRLCLNDMSGFASTAVLRNLEYNITTDLDNNWAGLKPADGIATSGWFIPSIGQWSKLQEILGTDFSYSYSTNPKLACNTSGQVNDKMVSLLAKIPTSGNLTKTFNGCYWSLTQNQIDTNGYSQLYCLDISNSKFEINLQNKTQKRCLRPILAF